MIVTLFVLFLFFGGLAHHSWYMTGTQSWHYLIKVEFYDFFRLNPGVKALYESAGPYLMIAIFSIAFILCLIRLLREMASRPGMFYEDASSSINLLGESLRQK